MTDITDLAQLRAELSNPANGSKDHLRKLALLLVEALEKAQQERENWRTSFDNERFRADKLKAYIDDMEPIRAAAEKLVRCKGRYHSEQNYRALAALFGVKTPDLPPLEHENVHYADAAEMEIAALRQRIAELEREQEHLRPVGVMSEQVFHRLENRECRFIALWPRPGIFLPRKRPEDGVIVYARTAAAAGIKVEVE
ncbi:ead/Ea22-like family protein [Klebsiella pneumoniae]|uniref:ead/Ea22-like family protein n=1 Tax=Klebsiella pneumoniae TaxID=573 RepID=UPI000EF99315|nr:ead/Ea22-like family protein [Klebsiella pneumoniae]RLZ83883.1 ead/Ea22-like family protein [Klebsiella pneumoniae]HCC6120091.1 ead/Ea22-like family protein [Klebsiella pneumoniae]HCM1783818.1 ead/Ea22-like family protein [Klebsiella pneumoniae]